MQNIKVGSTKLFWKSLNAVALRNNYEDPQIQCFRVEVEELECPAQSPGLNPTEYHWDELEC